MRKWSVAELERVEADILLVSAIVREDFVRTLNNPSSLLDSPADCDWLRERIEIREQHGRNDFQRCDGCSHGTAQIVRVVVSEYHDGMGAPSNLGISYVCQFHAQYN